MEKDWVGGSGIRSRDRQRIKRERYPIRNKQAPSKASIFFKWKMGFFFVFPTVWELCFLMSQLMYKESPHSPHPALSIPRVESNHGISHTHTHHQTPPLIITPTPTIPPLIPTPIPPTVPISPSIPPTTAFKLRRPPISLRIILLGALPAHIMLVVHVLGALLGVVASALVVVGVHAFCFGEAVDFGADEAGESFFCEGVGDCFACFFWVGD